MIVQAKATIKRLLAVYGHGGLIIHLDVGADLIKPQYMPRAFLSALESALLELAGPNFDHISSKAGFVFEGYDKFIHAINFSYFNAVHVKWGMLDHIPHCVQAIDLEEILSDVVREEIISDDPSGNGSS